MSIIRLSETVKAAVENICRIFDPDMGKVPYFGVALLDPRPHFYHIPFFDISHMPGRALDALLLAEHTFSLDLDEAVVECYRSALMESFAGEDALNGYYDEKLKRKRVAFHNLREGLQGLNALVKFRDDQKARACAERMVQRLSSLVNADGTWNPDRWQTHPEYLPLGDVVQHDKYLTSTAGRLIGSLVKYYTTTGNAQALDLATKFKSAVLCECFDEEGRATDKAGWHVHSITSTISSLALLAEALNDSSLKIQVGILYRSAFDGRIMTTLGWSKENLENDLDVGEINNTGDIIQTGLHLAEWESPQYYEDVERMLRSHVIPSQLLDTEWIQQVRQPAGDFERDIPSRVRGAFGFPAPYGHQAASTDFLNFNFDITCGGIQALCMVSNKVAGMNPDLHVNLLIDHTSPEVVVRSRFPASNEFTLEVFTSQCCDVRIPEWIEQKSIQVHRCEKLIPAWVDNGYLHLGKGPAVFQINFHAGNKWTEEWINGRSYHVNWKGNQVIAMEPTCDFLPFFNRAHLREAVIQGKQY